MNYKREIEKKFVIMDHNCTFAKAKYLLPILFKDGDVIEGVSTDTFWLAPGVDFVRLRRNTSELSIKVTDQDTIENRIEENIVVDDFDTAARFSTALFGQPIGELEKTYYVLTCPTFIIALYTVAGRKELFLEVESDDMAIVEDISNVLSHYFILKQEFRSLYQIVFGGPKPSSQAVYQ